MPWKDRRSTTDRPDSAARPIVRRYEASPAGDVVWRDLLAAPVWLPPPSTPDDEIGGEALGPGYRSAFGLVALVHEATAERRGSIVFEDSGIRTHGSVNYRSIGVGQSHGCHRLYNHLALRLGGFLLAHRTHQVLGEIEDRYQRRIVRGGRTFRLHRESHGFAYRFDDPIPLRVLPGRRLAR